MLHANLSVYLWLLIVAALIGTWSGGVGVIWRTFTIELERTSGLNLGLVIVIKC